MAGAAIAIDNAFAADTIRSIKERVFAANPELTVRRQRLMYLPGPRGMEPLADHETLGGAGVARDGSATLDVLLVEATAPSQAQIDANRKRGRDRSEKASREMRDSIKNMSAELLSKF